MVGAEPARSEKMVDADFFQFGKGDLLQVAGSDALNTQAWMTATADQTLLGEELFSAGAYLTRRPAQIAALQVQDALRLAAVIASLVGILVKSLT